MAQERFKTIYHDFAPTTPTVVYSVPSGYQAIVRPVRAYNVSPTTSTDLRLYQGSGVDQRTVWGATVDASTPAADDTPLAVASGFPLFLSQSVASAATVHMTAIESPLFS